MEPRYRLFIPEEGSLLDNYAVYLEDTETRGPLLTFDRGTVHLTRMCSASSKCTVLNILTDLTPLDEHIARIEQHVYRPLFECYTCIGVLSLSDGPLSVQSFLLCVTGCTQVAFLQDAKVDPLLLEGGSYDYNAISRV